MDSPHSISGQHNLSKSIIRDITILSDSDMEYCQVLSPIKQSPKKHNPRINHTNKELDIPEESENNSVSDSLSSSFGRNRSEEFKRDNSHCTSIDSTTLVPSNKKKDRKRMSTDEIKKLILQELDSSSTNRPDEIEVMKMQLVSDALGKISNSPASRASKVLKKKVESKTNSGKKVNSISPTHSSDSKKANRLKNNSVNDNSAKKANCISPTHSNDSKKANCLKSNSVNDNSGKKVNCISPTHSNDSKKANGLKSNSVNDNSGKKVNCISPTHSNDSKKANRLKNNSVNDNDKRHMDLIRKQLLYNEIQVYSSPNVNETSPIKRKKKRSSTSCNGIELIKKQLLSNAMKMFNSSSEEF